MSVSNEFSFSGTHDGIAQSQNNLSSDLIADSGLYSSEQRLPSALSNPSLEAFSGTGVDLLESFAVESSNRSSWEAINFQTGLDKGLQTTIGQDGLTGQSPEQSLVGNQSQDASLSVELYVNGHRVDQGAGAIAFQPGETLLWSYHLTNTGKLGWIRGYRRRLAKMA